MIYSAYLVHILLWLGYVQYDPIDSSGDFEVSQSGGVVTLTWYNTVPTDAYYPDGPAPEDIEAQAKPWAARTKKLEIKAWTAALNGRGFEHAANSEDFDDLIVRHRKATRYCINLLAEQEGLTARLSNADVKEQYALASPEFDLIDKGKQARKKMRDAVTALAADSLTTVEDVLGYVVSDATASTLHALAYPDADPTLESRLAEFPVLEE